MFFKRYFINYDRPIFPSLVELLRQEHQQGQVLQLENITIVLPTARSTELVLGELAQFCQQDHLLLRPPQCCTIGQLPEQLYRSKLPFASQITQQLSWCQALQSIDAEKLKKAIPTFEQSLHLFDLQGYANRFLSLHRELAGEMLLFEDVAKKLKELREEDEYERWQLFAEIQQKYFELLDQANLWDQQTARVVAAQQQEYHTDRELYLVGLVDLNKIQREMLKQIAKQVTVVLQADLKDVGDFDQYGCLLPESQRQKRIPISQEQIIVTESFASQADAVTQSIAALNGNYAASQIRVCCHDAMLTPHVERCLSNHNIQTRDAAGQLIIEGPVCSLLRLVSYYLQTESYDAFAALVRHPDLETILQNDARDYLAKLDQFYNRYFPEKVTRRPKNIQSDSQVAKLFQAFREKLSCFLEGKEPLTIWKEMIRQFLIEIYGERTFSKQQSWDRIVLKSIEVIMQSLLTWEELPQSLGQLKFSANQAILLLLGQLQSVRTADPINQHEIEILGWLDVVIDTAPVVIVTDFRSEQIPEAVNADIFLPNQLRCALGILDNQRRYARDAYYLALLLSSREKVVCITSRYSHDGNFSLPSRLLFQEEPKEVTRRVLTLFEDRLSRTFNTEPEKHQKTQFAIPKPKPLANKLKQFRITQFRDYLDCPYRFYLKHVLKLSAFDDRAQELQSHMVGNLFHDLFEAFGKQALKDPKLQMNAAVIVDFLEDQLKQVFARKHWDQGKAALKLQQAQIYYRLRQFAQVQATDAALGWQIIHAENVETMNVKQEVICWEIDGEQVELIGRIDRVDINEKLNKVRILDYKTAKTAKNPSENYKKHSQQWVDLQLPLYRHMVKPFAGDRPIELGYFSVPAAAQKIGIVLASWDEHLLTSADETAKSIIRKIWQERFWPPTKKLQLQRNAIFKEPFASICQSNVHYPWDESGEGA